MLDQGIISDLYLYRDVISIDLMWGYDFYNCDACINELYIGIF